MDLDVRCRTIKLLEIKSWENLQDLGLGNRFLAFTSKAQSKRKRLTYWTSSKWTFALWKKFKRRKLLTELFTKHLFDQSRIYNSKTNNPIRKWAKDMSRHFTKDELWNASKHRKRCWTSLVIRECKFKPRWFMTTSQNDKRKYIENTGCCWSYQVDLSRVAHRNVDPYSHSGERVWRF